MPAPDDMAERHRLMLGRLAELSMSLAERLHERAMQAATLEEAEGLALAFQRVSRSLRQTLALEARLERDRLRFAVEAEKARAEDVRVRAKRRELQARAVLTRLIWTEAERDEAERLVSRLYDRLHDEALFDRFADEPFDALIARLRRDLGLPANDAATSPPPHAGEGAAPPDWRSSA